MYLKLLSTLQILTPCAFSFLKEKNKERSKEIIGKHIILIYSTGRSGEHPFITLAVQRAVGRKEVSQAYTFGLHWDCRRKKGAEMGRCRLENGHSLELWLCHSSYELWSPQGRHLQHRLQKPRQIHPEFILVQLCSFKVNSAYSKRHESHIQVK